MGILDYLTLSIPYLLISWTYECFRKPTNRIGYCTLGLILLLPALMTNTALYLMGVMLTVLISPLVLFTHGLLYLKARNQFKRVGKLTSEQGILFSKFLKDNKLSLEKLNISSSKNNDLSDYHFFTDLKTTNVDDSNSDFRRERCLANGSPHSLFTIELAKQDKKSIAALLQLNGGGITADLERQHIYHQVKKKLKR